MSSQLAMKRLLVRDGEEEEGDEYLLREPKRRCQSFSYAVREVMKLQAMQGLVLELEPFLRRVVQEEVQKGLSRHALTASRPLFNQIQAFVTTRWQLCFKNKLPDTLFTGSRIEAEDNTSVQIVLLDSSSNTTVTSGPLSSIKIEIFALDGDFGVEELEEWTEKEFNDSVVREREGKRPLLTGDLSLTLRDGIGNFGDIIFTDNSSWIRSRKFRLGARALHNNCTKERIQEAVSRGFFVKDHRGELYKKHHPPALDDEVWRLEKIGKDGAFHRRLMDNGIKTVQDFLRFFVMDQEWLRSILGNGMSNKIWEATKEHAWECQLDQKFYSYYIAEQQVMLVFNSIFQVFGAKFDGHDYQHISKLPASQMALVNRLKQHAYKNTNEIIEIRELPGNAYLEHLCLMDQSPTPGSALLDRETPNYVIPHEDEQTMQVRFKHPFAHPQHDELSDDPLQLNHISTWQRVASVEHISSISTSNFDIRNFWGGRLGDHGMEPSTSGWVGMTGESLLGYDPVLAMANCFPHGVAWDLGSRPFQASGGETCHNYLSPTPGFSVQLSPSKWVQLMAALKCGMSIRRRVAAKRRARTPCLDYQTSADFPRSLC